MCEEQFPSKWVFWTHLWSSLVCWCSCALHQTWVIQKEKRVLPSFFEQHCEWRLLGMGSNTSVKEGKIRKEGMAGLRFTVTWLNCAMVHTATLPKRFVLRAMFVCGEHLGCSSSRTILALKFCDVLQSGSDAQVFFFKFRWAFQTFEQFAFEASKKLGPFLFFGYHYADVWMHCLGLVLCEDTWDPDLKVSILSYCCILGWKQWSWIFVLFIPIEQVPLTNTRLVCKWMLPLLA